jgi:crotonobetainyl-CoA:carnitine CoA-transferase CaiB-like acyl-CoA transferase
LGDFTYSGLPVNFSRTRYRVERSPLLGEHTRSVMDMLGFSDEEYAALEASELFN